MELFYHRRNHFGLLLNDPSLIIFHFIILSHNYNNKGPYYVQGVSKCKKLKLAAKWTFAKKIHIFNWKFCSISSFAITEEIYYLIVFLLH